MSFQFSNDAAAFIATSNSILNSHGISIRTGSDFEEYRQIVEEHRPTQMLGSPFDPLKHNFNSGTAFWLTGWNDEGQLIHTQAAKTLDLEGSSLAKYLLRNFRQFPPPLPGVDLKKSRFRASPGSHRISGDVVYHGEVWMAPEKGVYRGIGLSTILARTGILEIISRWTPEWIFGFMLQAVAFKGFSERMGYMHNEPRALLWQMKETEKPIEAFLTYLGREDALYMLDIPVSEYVAEAA